MTIVSLFSGIGGLEAGLSKAGMKTALFCDVDPAARVVLSDHFPDVEQHDDVRTLKSIPSCEILTAGFPCQDLSLAGLKSGISGDQSSLVSEVFRLLRRRSVKPRWVVFENVPYMLILNKGRGMEWILDQLEELHYNWAYRVVDARSFGLPQRRRRVLLVASKTEDPRDVLLSDEHLDFPEEARPSKVQLGPSYGFYWTMGKMGAGWAKEATPPIKGGSGIGIPSPPAIWMSSENLFGTPTIDDAERLQGFPAGWTSAVVEKMHAKVSLRWRLVGNAVCPPMSSWLGDRLLYPSHYRGHKELSLWPRRWPSAAYGIKGRRVAVAISEWPVDIPVSSLRTFLEHPLKPLSHRAASGFLNRALQSKEIAWSSVFLESLSDYVRDAAA